MGFIVLCSPSILYSQWENFVPPNVEFIDHDLGSTIGSQLHHDLIPDPETFIRDGCFEVCKVLYDRYEDAPVVTDVTYYIEDYDGIAVTWGPRPHVYVRYSTRWIQRVWQNSGGDNDAVLYETTGVLYHELTHGYQQNGNNIPSHAVEGLADAVRIALGYVPYANRRSGGSYTNSYQRTGFFLDWLDQERFPGYNFLRRFNQTANPQTSRPWSWEVVAAMTGVDVDTLWAEYQEFLSSPLAASFAFISHDTDRIVDFEDKSISVIPVARWHWDFGDGAVSTQPNPQHVYAQDRDYLVTLTVTTAAGSDRKTHLVPVPHSIPYCQSQSQDCTGEWIAEAVIGDMTNTSAGSNYSDYTGVTVELQSQEICPISLIAGFTGRTFRGGQYRIWIDYDGDRTFNDGEELVFDSGYTNQPFVTGQIAVPPVLQDVWTRMRVSMKGSDLEAANLTDLGGAATAQYEDSPQNQDKEKAFDNSDYTKYLTFHDHGWIQFRFGEGEQYPISSYSVTSANDYPQRDPRDWQLMGSNNGSNWVTLDTQSNQSFSKRFETRNYICPDQTPYRYFRLNVTRNNGANKTQFSEIRLFGSMFLPQPGYGDFGSGEVEDYTIHITKSAIESFEYGFETLPWESSGDASWEVTSAQAHTGTRCAKAGTINDGELSVLSVTVDCTGADLSFWVKVSSESGCDALVLEIDGVRAGAWSGNRDWMFVSVPLVAGNHRLEWSYSKDSSVSDGEDTAWIDDITFPIR